MLLVCSKRCGGKLFRALFTEVEVDASGAYQSHQVVQPGYICINCGAPALDLSEVPNAIEAEAQEDEPATAVTDILCPVCETMVQVDASMECPNCGAPLEVG